MKCNIPKHTAHSRLFLVSYLRTEFSHTFIPPVSLLSHHPFCAARSYLSRCEGWKRYYYGVSGWREETGVATRIAWGERGANDGRTGLVSGLWYLLDVIDGERRGKRRRAGTSFSLPARFIWLFLGHSFVGFLSWRGLVVWIQRY